MTPKGLNMGTARLGFLTAALLVERSILPSIPFVKLPLPLPLVLLQGLFGSMLVTFEELLELPLPLPLPAAALTCPSWETETETELELELLDAARNPEDGPWT